MKTSAKKPRARALKEKRTSYKMKISAATRAQNPVVKKQVHLSVNQAEQLAHFAEARAVSEDEIVAKALNLLFSLTDMLDERAERRTLSLLSEESLKRVWDNEQDARYDNWRELYAVPTR